MAETVRTERDGHRITIHHLRNFAYRRVSSIDGRPGALRCGLQEPLSPWEAPFFFGKRFQGKQRENVSQMVKFVMAGIRSHPGLEIILTIGLGALLAADRALPLAFVVSLAILLGLLHGILNGSELANRPASSELVAVGVTVGLFVLVSLLAGQAASVRARWQRVAVRVAGSWIAAIGLLMLGWATHGTA